MNKDLESKIENLQKDNELLFNTINNLENKIDSLINDNNDIKNRLNLLENNNNDLSNNDNIDFVNFNIKNKPINNKYTLIRHIEPVKIDDQFILKFNRKLTLPLKIDLRSKCPIIYDQGILGSCTANALLCLYQYDAPKFIGSRLFLYYNERLLDGTVNDDVGSYLETGIYAMKKYGVCREILWPYNISKFNIKPNNFCYTEALTHQVIEAFQVKPNPYDMKACLNTGEPFVFGFAVFSNFESITVAKTGFVTVPTKNDQFLGGHAVVCVGYDDNLLYNGIKGYWICRNSWGALWGDSGYFYLPYKYLDIPNIFSDLWKITKVEL